MLPEQTTQMCTRACVIVRLRDWSRLVRFARPALVWLLVVAGPSDTVSRSSCGGPQRVGDGPNAVGVVGGRRPAPSSACDYCCMAVTVGELIAALEGAYPPELAESWDAVGLACGDPGETVERVLVCVDPVAATVAEAAELGAQLIVAHHPLLLHGVHGVPANTAKGALVHRMIRSATGLFCAHTNADAAAPGVSDALAATLGVRVSRPLAPHADGRTGIGRIGELAQPEPFGEFVSRVGAALPATAPGVLGAGDPERPIRTVALAGGAGEGYLAAATAAGVDAYVTADLRHHPAGEHLEQRGDTPALVGLTHWASEWPWCAQAAEVIAAAGGGSVDVHVSRKCTDPWDVSALGGTENIMREDDRSAHSNRSDASVSQNTGGTAR